MIKTIIFDFGNVFINLDIERAKQDALDQFNITSFSEDLIAFNKLYEIGSVSTREFLEFYSKQFPEVSDENVTTIWNAMLLDFPRYRLDFLKTLRKNSDYKLILLSNTNDLHISWIKKHIPFYNAFKNCFDAFYLSHEIGLRKPDKNIFEFVLDKNKIIAEECLFIDDVKENTDAANQLDIHTWNIKAGKEDIINLFKEKKDLF